MVKGFAVWVIGHLSDLYPKKNGMVFVEDSKMTSPPNFDPLHPFAALTNSQDEICWSVAAPNFGAFHVFVGAQLSRGANHPATPEELLGGAPSDASLADSDTSRSVPPIGDGPNISISDIECVEIVRLVPIFQCLSNPLVVKSAHLYEQKKICAVEAQLRSRHRGQPFQWGQHQVHFCRLQVTRGGRNT